MFFKKIIGNNRQQFWVYFEKLIKQLKLSIHFLYVFPEKVNLKDHFLFSGDLYQN